MKQMQLLQEIRKMRFEEAYRGWTEGRLSQEEAGLEGLIDKRLEQVSHRRAPVDEVLALTQRYRMRHEGWNVKHCYVWYRREGGCAATPG